MSLIVLSIGYLPRGGTNLIAFCGVLALNKGVFATQLALHFVVTLSCAGVTL